MLIDPNTVKLVLNTNWIERNHVFSGKLSQSEGSVSTCIKRNLPAVEKLGLLRFRYRQVSL
jgi:hypothetical protein